MCTFFSIMCLYKVWGQEGGAIDFYKIMTVWWVEIPKSQMDIMLSNLHTAVNFILAEGRNSEEWYDAIGFNRITDEANAKKEEVTYYSNIFYWFYDLFILLNPLETL